MPKPLFVIQSVCASRGFCKQCRDPRDDQYRKAWSERYEMPEGWPECPAGYPMGFEGFPAPVPSEKVRRIIENPDDKEAGTIRAQLQARADLVRPFCQRCPGGYFKGATEDGLIVDCQVGYKCCGGGLSRGRIYLPSGSCHKGFWKVPEAK